VEKAPFTAPFLCIFSLLKLKNADKKPASRFFGKPVSFFKTDYAFFNGFMVNE